MQNLLLCSSILPTSAATGRRQFNSFWPPIDLADIYSLGEYADNGGKVANNYVKTNWLKLLLWGNYITSPYLQLPNGKHLPY